MEQVEQRLRDIREKLKPRLREAVLLKDMRYCDGIIPKGTQGIIIDEFYLGHIQLDPDTTDSLITRFLFAKRQGAWLISFKEGILSVRASLVDLVREGPCMEESDVDFVLQCIHEQRRAS